MELDNKSIYKPGQMAIFPGDGTELTIVDIDKDGICTVAYKAPDGETGTQILFKNDLYLFGFPKFDL